MWYGQVSRLTKQLLVFATECTEPGEAALNPDHQASIAMTATLYSSNTNRDNTKILCHRMPIHS